MQTQTTNPNGLMKACGLFLLAGSVLLIAGFLVHPTESASNDEFRAIVAAHVGASRAAHYLILAGLIGIAAATPVGALASFQVGQPAAATAGGLLAGGVPPARQTTVSAVQIRG